MIDPKQRRLTRVWEQEVHKPEQYDSGVSPLREPPHRLRCNSCDNVYGGTPQPSLDRLFWLGYCGFCRSIEVLHGES